MDVQDRRNRILQFNITERSLATNDYKRVLLQLLGYVGHGKSSFVNSCIYTLSDGEYEIKSKAAEGQGSYGSHTMERLAFQLTESITIVDNRGYGMLEDYETGEVYAQLGNFLPLNEKVEWKKDFVEIMNKIEDSDVTPNYSDFIVPVFVYSVKTTLTEDAWSNVKTLFKNCRDMTGVYPIVVLTNKLSNPNSGLESKFKAFGAEQVHAVENYTPGDNLKTRGRCQDLQRVLENALMDAEFRMKQQRNPIKERIERKKFLLKFAYQFTVKEKEKEATKKEYVRLQKAAREMWFGRFPK